MQKISRVKLEVEREDGIIASLNLDEMTLEFKDLGEFLANLETGIVKTFEMLGTDNEQ